ncbi:hypothetical protein ATANTOWER_003544 [Ataeniobius toweri]|uniref:Ubiquitin-like protease family profile domain-containing protein n=1 Tax=Ataeniobius toweri TaxID=208326 RepID=A0ABU7AX63_9TELE|nr:hypothetical protein [Ataeniobius toweri]
MQQTRNNWRKAKCLNRRRGFMSSVKGVSHLSRRDKRRFYYKLQFWLWRKRSERCRFWIFRSRRRSSGIRVSSSPHLNLKSQKNQVFTSHLKNNENSNVTDSPACSGSEEFGLQRAQRLQMGCSLEQHSPCLQETWSEKTISCLNNSSIYILTREIHDFLEGFYRSYGSFIPLHQSDVLRHLNRKFNSNFNDRKNLIFSVVDKYRTAIIKTSASLFQVVHKKHILSLEDLLTLADEHWLNDQVMNMYGELIMESSHHKVHFLNSFFHRQLMTKGYDGVRRWTKQVDLFSKRLLLVPIHLEVHWCLVTADISTKKICLYDSQGHSLQKVARNILKYLMSEAKEKKLAAFEDGWTVSSDENIPQQANENDCGVFVLEYSRCLALSRPFQFSQQDIPKIRKRIYKELCDCKLHEQD